MLPRPRGLPRPLGRSFELRQLVWHTPVHQSSPFSAWRRPQRQSAPLVSASPPQREQLSKNGLKWCTGPDGLRARIAVASRAVGRPMRRCCKTVTLHGIARSVEGPERPRLQHVAECAVTGVRPSAQWPCEELSRLASIHASRSHSPATRGAGFGAGALTCSRTCPGFDDPTHVSAR